MHASNEQATAISYTFHLAKQKNFTFEFAISSKILIPGIIITKYRSIRLGQCRHDSTLDRISKCSYYSCASRDDYIATFLHHLRILAELIGDATQ